MDRSILDVNDNAYIDKMYCWYCKNCWKKNKEKILNERKYILAGNEGCPAQDKELCSLCGTKYFSPETVNVQTDKIPVRMGYSYNHFPSQLPDVWYYGSYNGKLIPRF